MPKDSFALSPHYVQPTIKIPVDYRFNVRVNRDILFDASYAPFTDGSVTQSRSRDGNYSWNAPFG
ncbi:MAG: hypothetical protein ABI165_12330, partial [Bryobacteraceae bacterium]